MARIPIAITLIDDGRFKQFSNQLLALGDERGRIAMARAINRAASTAYTAVTRAIQTQTSAPRAIVRQEVRLSKAAWHGTGEVQAVIYAHGSELPLADFAPKQFSYGVRAKVWGKMERFPHTFIMKGNFRSGDPIAGDHVFVRNGRTPKGGSRANSFAEVFGPSLPKELVKDETAATFQRVASVELEKRLRYELGKMLGV